MEPKIPVIKGYIIFDPITGKYSRGGSDSYGLWGKKPKIWSNIGHLKNHINLLLVDAGSWRNKNIRVLAIYRGAVVYDVTTGKPADFDIYAYAIDYAKRKAEKQHCAVEIL